MNKLKYLLLILVLASIFFYTSCATKQVVKEVSRDNVKDTKDYESKEEVGVIEEISVELAEGEGEDRGIPFDFIEKAPTFPSCEEGNRVCFSKMVQKYFDENFDENLPKILDLESGKKSVGVFFIVDKKGNVVDAQATTPHPKIKTEVLRIINSLPKMTPGESKGEKMDVKYFIEFVIVVE